MKSITLFILVCLISVWFTGCKSSEENGFMLTGTIEGYGNGQIVFTQSIPGMRRSDTIDVVNDRFEYRGSVQSPCLFFFRIIGNEVLDRPFAQGLFMIENSSLHFDANIEDVRNFVLKGSPSNDELKGIYESLGGVTTDFSQARSAYRQAVREKTDTDTFRSEMEQKRDVFIDHLESIDNFENSHAVAYIIFNNFSNLTRPQVSQLLSKFSSDLDENVYLSYMRNRLESEESIAIGVQAPEFTLFDPDGNQVHVSDYRGKLLLLAFSASWCTWCKREIPYLQAVYEQYDKNDLEILTVNLDTTRELWLSDIEADNVPWPVVSDLKAFEGQVVKDYAIFAIPRIFLIDAEGLIQGMNLRGDMIKEAVTEQIN